MVSENDRSHLHQPTARSGLYQSGPPAGRRYRTETIGI